MVSRYTMASAAADPPVRTLRAGPWPIAFTGDKEERYDRTSEALGLGRRTARSAARVVDDTDARAGRQRADLGMEKLRGRPAQYALRAPRSDQRRQFQQ